MKKHFLLFCSTMMSMSLGVYAQNIKTIAGNGTAGYVADGVAATSTQLNNPTGIAVDAAGNVYIADASNNRVRKVSTAGIITTVAGSGVAGYSGDGAAATLAQLKYPTSVAADNAGNIYITDGNNFCIRKVNAAGIISTYAGTGSLGFAGDGGPATAAKLFNPLGLFLDNTNNLYIADVFNQRIRKVDASGIITSVAGSGTMGYGGDDSSANIAKFNSPSGVCKDAAGNVYIADKANNRVRKVNPTTGIITTVAGKDTMGFSGDGGPATAAKLNKPVSVKMDKENNLYITDLGNNRIRKVSASGIITTIAGVTAVGSGGDGGPATAASFNFPSDVVLDTAGNIYIADPGNNRIRKIQILTTGAQTIKTQNAALALFPNPASGSFTIELPIATENVMVTIEDVTGRIVDTKSISTKTSKIHYPIPNIPTGIYIVKAFTESTLYSGKLEVNK